MMAVFKNQKEICRCRWCGEKFANTLEAMDHGIVQHPKKIRGFNGEPFVQDSSKGVVNARQ